MCTLNWQQLSFVSNLGFIAIFLHLASRTIDMKVGCMHVCSQVYECTLMKCAPGVCIG